MDFAALGRLIPQSIELTTCVLSTKDSDETLLHGTSAELPEGRSRDLRTPKIFSDRLDGAVIAEPGWIHLIVAPWNRPAPVRLTDLAGVDKLGPGYPL